jgi:hypothetical protein
VGEAACRQGELRAARSKRSAAKFLCRHTTCTESLRCHNRIYLSRPLAPRPSPCDKVTRPLRSSNETDDCPRARPGHPTGAALKKHKHILVVFSSLSSGLFALRSGRGAVQQGVCGATRHGSVLFVSFTSRHVGKHSLPFSLFYRSRCRCAGISHSAEGS